jgi:uncharacterized lipoprotein YbaY
MCAFAPLMLATTALSAVGSIMQGNAAADAGAAQQAAYNQAAENERLAAGYEATRVYDKGRRAQSAALVQVAGSGVSLAGSPTEVLADNAIQTQMDVDAIRFGSQIKQQNLRTQGDLAFMQGQQRQQAGYLGALTTVAGGLTQLYTPRASVRLGGSSFGVGA